MPDIRVVGPSGRSPAIAASRDAARRSSHGLRRRADGVSSHCCDLRGVRIAVVALLRRGQRRDRRALRAGGACLTRRKRDGKRGVVRQPRSVVLSLRTRFVVKRRPTSRCEREASTGGVRCTSASAPRRTANTSSDPGDFYKRHLFVETTSTSHRRRRLRRDVQEPGRPTAHSLLTSRQASGTPRAARMPRVGKDPGASNRLESARANRELAMLFMPARQGSGIVDCLLLSSGSAEAGCY